MKQPKTILFGAFAAICLASACVMIASPALAQEKENESGTKPAPMAKITPVQAMKTAEGKTGGKAAMAVFEYDDGHWIYGVVIAKKHKLMEVEIDSTTGKIQETENVTPAGEAKELQEDLTSIAKAAN